MLIKCPICHNRHIVQEYDKEFICQNTDDKIFEDMVPTDLLTRDGYNWNRNSTKVDEVRPVTVLVSGPDYRENGEKISSQGKKNW